MSQSELKQLLSAAVSGQAYSSSKLRETFIQIASNTKDSTQLAQLADTIFEVLPSYTPSVNGSENSNESAKALYYALSLEERVKRAIDEFRLGHFVLVIDGADRENEGDLIMAAEKATESSIAFMVNETSGLICVGCSGERIDSLGLPQMVNNNTEQHCTAFTISVDYNIGTTTGISASDRAATLRAIADPSITRDKFNSPGHMFPLRAREGGVLVRTGHTEASVDLCKLAGLFPAGALCEIVRKDGAMMRPGELYEYARKHQIALLTIDDLVQYRKSKNL